MNIQKENWRFEYPLTADSVVFDVGGYHGDWAAEIAARFNAQVSIFEPMEQFYDIITRRFANHPKVHAFNYGLAGHNGVAVAWESEDASGIYGCVGVRQVIQLRDVAEVMSDVRVDLIKINIEGGEYELLNRLVDTRQITQCVNIQVQFHKVAPNAEEARSQLWDRLKHTHYLTRNEPFVWENWSLLSHA